jgi:hypothetical protein
MKRFDDYLDESLAAEVKSEPKSAAAQQARKLGLTYGGFGRYLDKKGVVAYIVDRGKLVPYKGGDDHLEDLYSKAMDHKAKSKSKPAAKKGDKKTTKTVKEPDPMDEYKRTEKAVSSRRNQDEKLRNKFENDAYKVDGALQDYFYDYLSRLRGDYMDTLTHYTESGYEDINRYLYKGHDEGANKTRDSELVRMISTLDEILDDAEAPFPYSTYSGLSERYKPENIVTGERYIFRGYLSSSLRPQMAINTFTNESSNKRVVLQIDVQPGQKALYADGFSSNSGEMETIMPRGSMVEIISGPHIMSDDSVSDRGFGESQIYLFHCALVQETEEE